MESYKLGDVVEPANKWHSSLLYIPPGHFSRGCHEIYLTNPFAVATKLITGCSWFSAQKYCNFLSAKLKKDKVYSQYTHQTVWGVASSGIRWDEIARGYRLLSEAEWEYVYQLSQYSSSLSSLEFSEEQAEWVWDYYQDYPDPIVIDPTGSSNGSMHTCRGVAYRAGKDPNVEDPSIGFRLCLTLPPVFGGGPDEMPF